MIKRFSNSKKLYTFLLVFVLTQGCAGFRLNTTPALPTPQDIATVVDEATVAPTVIIPALIDATATVIIPTVTSLPSVTITAVKGNIFIRRGPGLPYNPVGVLYKGTSADVIARDVLSKWVQVAIPNTDQTGWVSIQTEYSKLNGEFDSLSDFTFTDWPVPAYLYNCTEHDMYIMPGEIVLTSYFTYPDNQVWLNPGTYTVFDQTMPDRPEVMKVDIREGTNKAILDDGSGGHHKCP